MKPGIRKLIIALFFGAIICAVALIVKDSSVIYATGSMLTTVGITVIYGYAMEYKNGDVNIKK